MKEIIKIIVLSNYRSSHSMNKYASNIIDALHANQDKFHVKEVFPKKICGNIFSNSKLNKWLAYIDKYVIFTFFLFLIIISQIKNLKNHKKVIIHITDHSNAIYILVIRPLLNLLGLKNIHIYCTCHDFTAIKSAKNFFKSHKTKISGKILQHLISTGLKYADFYICVSTNTEIDLKRFIIQNPKSKVIYNMLCDNFLMPSRSNDKTFDFISVSSGQWYKNRLNILKAFQIIDSNNSELNFKEISLAIVGAKLNTEEENITKNFKNIKITNLTKVSTEELILNYQRSKFLIFASISEGFGWPIIEAQSQYCIPIISDIEPLREIANIKEISDTYISIPVIDSSEGPSENEIANSIMMTLKLNQDDILKLKENGRINSEFYNKDYFYRELCEFYSNP